jgi:hypothetical protein
LARERGYAPDHARDVSLHVVKLPLSQLDGGLDNRPRALKASVGEFGPERIVHLTVSDQKLGKYERVLGRLRAPLGNRRGATVCSIAN